MTNRRFEAEAAILPEQEQISEKKVATKLEQRAQALAKSQKLKSGYSQGKLNLLERLSDQEQLLQAAYNQFRQSSEAELTVSYAAEWLLDNFYVVQQTLHMIREDLPQGYYRWLPKLDSGDEFEGIPRIYTLAREMVLHDQCQLDLDRIKQFVWAYQTITPLTMGEVWALPIMLRFVILESLAQATARLTNLIDNIATPSAPLELSYDLTDADTVAYCIPSLRILASQDWKEFFESISQVEQILDEDPANLYNQMDFETRDRYRGVIEKIARATGQDEVEVARAAVQMTYTNLAQHDIDPTSTSTDDDPWQGLELPYTSHVGFYLIGEGRSQLENLFNYRPSGMDRIRRAFISHPTGYYVGSVILLSILIILAVVSYTISSGGTVWQITAAALLAFIPATTMAITLFNWLITQILPPRTLPKLDFSQGVPTRCRTIVVIPALLTNSAEIESLLAELELHHLRNPDPELRFALLTDFIDAPQEQTPEDEALIYQARTGIERLNRRYQNRPFYLFHRRRLWNPQENIWMGWERKRGKLHEFNRLLRGDSTTSYTVQVGDLDQLGAIRYLITLDADTILPRDSARRLVATLAHPINQAQFDPNTGQVISGYTILQPRTEVKPVSANQSLFTRVFSGDTGIDLYTLAVSDVYQDLFGEGIYVGKGIYDIDAFEQSLKDRVPENSLLSHDLFEGIHGRAGLVTDVILYEDYPPHYLVQTRRYHRWVRGDWQLLPWLLPRTPNAAGQKVPNPLSFIDRWQIADNLRRSLVAPALLFLFLAGWLWLPGSPVLWTLFGIITPAGPFITGTIDQLVRLLRGARWRDLSQPIFDSAIRWLLALAFLPYEALLVLDAILITLTRLFITRKNLLQWTTAASTARLFGSQARVQLTWQQMISAVLLSGSLGLIIYLTHPLSLIPAFPLLVAWLLSPEIAYWISRPLAPPVQPLTLEQRQQLRTLARRTWLFFEQFVGPHDNWLPPDHFQEHPKGVVAHRTSPTNMGLLLLSTLAAYDLGYIDLLELALRLRSTFDTFRRLERYRGHFLNWIDTYTLNPLPPRYISTVDSGNLAACLLTLKQGCLMIGQQPAWRWERWQGLLDTLTLLTEIMNEIETDEPEETVAAFQQHVSEMIDQIRAMRAEPQQWVTLLTRLLAEDLPRLDQLLVEWVEAGAQGMGAEQVRDLRRYTERLHHHVQGMQREVELLLPWLLPLNQPPVLFSHSNLDPAIAEAWQTLVELLTSTPTLNEVDHIYRSGRTLLNSLQQLLSGEAEETQEAQSWCQNLAAKLGEAEIRVKALLVGYEQVSQEANNYVREMDFDFLFDRRRQVFHIGFNMDTGRLDRNYYDLLASEARIASIVTIATHNIPQSHWLHLGRPLRHLAEGQTLLSWSGTMFEYLMPPLLMRSYEGTLLHQSVNAAADYQIAYGHSKNVPWGISESGYYAFDTAMSYQYRAFGAPGLGFKRGLADDLVITPYASLMALSLRPQAVLSNLDHLIKLNMMGRYGLYEAIDYTQSRLTLGQEYAIVASYMAHHQGMIMLALDNYLQKEMMVQRFHADPFIQSVELLLQERIPQPMGDETSVEEVPDIRPGKAAAPITPWEVPIDPPMPQAHYLSNGRYGLLLTSAGGGYSQWQETTLTRWRADTTLDNWGAWLYIQDEEDGRYWSATYQPTAVPAGNQRVFFHPHMVEFRRRDHDISLLMEVCVALDDDVEMRVVTLTNESNRPRRLRLVTYGEVVLASQGADERHPAFAKLFVQSEYLADHNALLFRRRPRSAKEEPIYLAHLLVAEDGVALTGAYESSRVEFVGRGHTPRTPGVLEEQAPLSGATGATLDPIFALGQVVELKPHASVKIAALTLVAKSRREALAMAERYRRWVIIDRAFNQARSRTERELRHLGLDSSSLEPIQHLLSLLFYPHPARRAEPHILAANQKGQSSLWAYSISGDYPVLLVRIREEGEIPLVHELLQAHIYWRSRQLKVDLVIINQEESGYGQEMQGNLFRLIHRTNSGNWLNQRGGIFILRRDQLSEADQILLQTVARVILDGDRGSLSEQLAGLYQQSSRLPSLTPSRPLDELEEPIPPVSRPAKLQFDNGFGGFSQDGKEYLVYLKSGEATPAPWINVIANEDFGFLISETGSGYSWSVNSGENRLSTWRNDPVSDLPSEALYLRDEETAEIWTPTPQPAPALEPYLVRHSAGYTIFEHHSHGLQHRLRCFVAPEAPLKIVQLRVENLWRQPRRLTATYYLEWVLGTNRESSQQYIVTEYNREQQALLAYNRYNTEFSERVAFIAASKEPHGLTADRTEFLGRMGSLSYPAALRRIGLESRIGAGLDPCAAIQLHLDLAPGGSEEIYFLIGQAADRTEAEALIRQYQAAGQVMIAWQAVQALWRDILETVQVETPDPAMNLLLNRWLLYQALACRIWGRSALYQSSGAYGFRDQLQDVTSIIYARPDLARAHILRAARHQFLEGDVLHWWHPPSGRGVRTLIRDDLLWLPYVTAHYVALTGDETILNEQVPFLKGEPLKGEEEERYGHYESTQESYSLYEHCRRALSKGDTAGSHALPLMGAGDWNDGMNRVGIEGQGESIWLGWFLYTALTKFADLAERIGEPEHAAAYRHRAEKLCQAMEAHGWDGAWYRRAYYDDGTPLGSVQNRECQIDAIAQSWGVISGAAEPERARQAMQAVMDRLVRWDDRLILLFTPPFDKTPRDPGYIKGYLPGIRENGGQYTHAALWTIWAMAELGDGETAEALFRLINPIYRADTPEKAAQYHVEPYVISADVYSVPPHTGRGGWTWYTGSSGWMYRLGVEAILGLRRQGQTLWLEPHIPREWPGYRLTYRHGNATYNIQVQNPEGLQQGIKQVTLDGQPLPDGKIPLEDDGRQHQVDIVLT